MKRSRCGACGPERAFRNTTQTLTYKTVNEPPAKPLHNRCRAFRKRKIQNKEPHTTLSVWIKKTRKSQLTSLSSILLAEYLKNREVENYCLLYSGEFIMSFRLIYYMFPAICLSLVSTPFVTPSVAFYVQQQFNCLSAKKPFRSNFRFLHERRCLVRDLRRTPQGKMIELESRGKKSTSVKTKKFKIQRTTFSRRFLFVNWSWKAFKIW